MQGHTTLKVWLVLVVVFVLGTFTGAFTRGRNRFLSRYGSQRSECTSRSL